MKVLLAGVALNGAGNPEGSMGIASGDYDRRWRRGPVRHQHHRRDLRALHQRRPRQASTTRVSQSGLAQPTAAFTGFGTDWIDYDNDGWLDLFVTNGAVNIIEGLRGQPVPYRMRNLLFRNLGTGTVRRDVGVRPGPAFARAEVGRAAAFGDIDNDGDTDVLVTNNTGPVRLWLNQVGTGRRGCRCVSTTARPTGSVSARSSTWSVLACRRSSAASAPTAAISPRRTRRCSSVSASGADRSPSASTGREVRRSDGRSQRSISA